MTKPVIIGVAAVVVLALAGGGYALMNKDDKNGSSANQAEQQTNENATEAEGTEASFNSISTSGKAQECTFTYSGSEGSGTGKMYSDGKGRGRMTLNVTSEQGNSGETNTIVTTDKAYTWFSGGGQNLGFVFDKASFDNRSGSNTTSSTSGTDPGKNFTMNCKNWSVDEEMLTPPSDINFTSLPTTSQ